MKLYKLVVFAIGINGALLDELATNSIILESIKGIYMNEWKLIIKNNLSEIATVVENIDILVEKWDLPMKVAFNLNLAIEELITNTISYGYQDEAEHQIEIFFTLSGNLLNIIISDDAIAFNPLENGNSPDLNTSIDEKSIGGLGIFFAKNITDSMAYKYKNERNILSLGLKVS